MDPDSSYIPLSLHDTLTKPRTYHSNKTASNSTRPPPRPSNVASSSFNAKERADNARREAALMMQTLGMGGQDQRGDVEATPRPDRSYNNAGSALPRTTPVAGSNSVEVAGLRAALSDKIEELAALRREVAVLEREKVSLVQRYDKLEREKKDAVAAAGGAGAGLDVKQLEELERQFEQQEKLLSGYQREAEKSAAEMEGLKNRYVLPRFFLPSPQY
jgi:DNA repair exonuclease SbcCD ATPase subunit